MSADVKSMATLLTVEEACGVLRIGRSTLYELCAAGEIRHVKIGRRKLFRADALQDFISANESGVHPSPPSTARAKR